MVSNKHVDLRKIDNFVRGKYYPEDISNHKRKKTNFRKPCKNFKIVNWYHLTYKGGRRLIFDSYRKHLIPQYHSFLP